MRCYSALVWTFYDELLFILIRAVIKINAIVMGSHLVLVPRPLPGVVGAVVVIVVVVMVVVIEMVVVVVCCCGSGWW